MCAPMDKEYSGGGEREAPLSVGLSEGCLTKLLKCSEDIL